MPCYDPRDDENRIVTKRRLDEATRAACELYHVIDKLAGGFNYNKLVSAETLNWVLRHRDLDKARELLKNEGEI